MKLSKFAGLLMIGLALTVAATGCKKKPGSLTPLPNGKAGQVGDPNSAGKIGGGESTTSGENTSPVSQANPGEFDNYTRDAEMFKQDMVFFAYDSSVIRSGEKSKVSKVATYLKSNPGTALEVGGHCDERGTEEYNRSLGERRALAARQELIAQGVDGSKVITKSFGKDRPIEPLHSESAWSKNRRDEFILLTPPK